VAIFRKLDSRIPTTRVPGISVEDLLVQPEN
jgi:hypothetical protein